MADNMERFEQQDVLPDLDEAIDLHRAALALCPLGHPDRSISLNNLADSLNVRFEQRGALPDLDETIELYRAVLALCPQDHPDRSMSLYHLAISLRIRFEQQGALPNLDEAIDLYRAALALCPLGHPDRSMSLNRLGNSLNTRFEQRGALPDLNGAIELNRAALALCPLGHSGRSMSLNNLANSLLARFEQQGALSGLDAAIELHGAALVLCPLGHPDRSISLNNLANSLNVRFKQQGALPDLDEAIWLHRVALALCPLGHPDRSMSLNNLANSLGARFEQQGALPDLNEAIELHRAALALCTLGNPDRSISLSNLAIGLDTRFEQQGALPDLNEAIELHRAALAIRPLGHSLRYQSLNNLANSLRVRSKQQGALSDLDEAVELYRAAFALLSPSHFLRSSSLNNLAKSLLVRFEQQSMTSDLEEAFGLYLQLPEISHAVSCKDLYAAKSWAASAEQLNHHSALVAYQTALELLDRHVTVLSSFSRHFDVIREATSSIAMDAFSCSVRHGALTTAVELVERGRAVFWTQLARFRTPLDELSASGGTGEALAEEFKQLSFRIRKALDALDVSLEDRSSQIRQLIIQWDGVISRIRRLPDFSRFLLPPLFSDLQKAGEDGPVIIVNASRYSCDALIVLISQDPAHVSLDITQAEVSELTSTFQSLTSHAGTSDHKTESYKIVGVLRTLWRRVVASILEVLRKFVPRGSRIWWCPTAEFTLLPLHAAGPYEPNSHNFSHFYVSSYTPTLATLIRARRQGSRDASSQHFVAIGQASPDRAKELRCVAAELDIVAQRVAPFLSFTSLAGSDATVQGAFDTLSQKQWLHLACHGMPNQEEPFESSFAMYDGSLMIKDIIRTRLQDPEFAFLSACHTTVGDKWSPDEAIHLAAAMQFSGFRSVIGSMWSIDDDVAGQIVSHFYDNLVDDSGRLDCKRAARALHKAVKKLRKQIPFEQQIVFVHIGV
ncbi:CHAT domain-containing protein [Suillus subluteus]|nr:CHAT domain-containing protein [Suillus subluteus]